VRNPGARPSAVVCVLVLVPVPVRVAGNAVGMVPGSTGTGIEMKGGTGSERNERIKNGERRRRRRKGGVFSPVRRYVHL
jgi:hypothetical protein